MNFPLATPGQKKEIDILMSELGIKTEQMMEVAARDIANFCRTISKKRILIFCGKGHNAGDGLVAAKYLCNYNVPVAVVLVEPEEKLGNIEKTALQVLKHMKVSIISIHNKEIVKIASKATLFVDALVGYRLHANPKSPIKEAIELMNSFNKKVVAIDIPTGIDSLSGEKHKPYVKATHTLALGIPLKGLQYWNGKLYVSDIGIPDRVYSAVKLKDKPRFKKSIIRIK